MENQQTNLDLDVDDIANSCQSWIWDKLVNEHNIPLGEADIIASQVQFLIASALADLVQDVGLKTD